MRLSEWITFNFNNMIEDQSSQTSEKISLEHSECSGRINNETTNTTTMQTENQPTNNTLKITRDKSGKFVRAEKALVIKKEGKKLTCIITGKSRPTNQKYLDAKASKLGVSVEELIKNYVSKEGLKQMTKETPRYEELMKFNGGTRTTTKSEDQLIQKAA